MEELSFGKKLKKLRKSRGLSQKQLADEIGKTARIISYYENEESCQTMPKMEFVILVSDYFNVPIDYFYKSDDSLVIKSRKEENDNFMRVNQKKQTKIESENIKELRLKKVISQRELAEKTNLSRSFIAAPKIIIIDKYKNLMIGEVESIFINEHDELMISMGSNLYNILDGDEDTKIKAKIKEHMISEYIDAIRKNNSIVYIDIKDLLDRFNEMKNSNSESIN